MSLLKYSLVFLSTVTLAGCAYITNTTGMQSQDKHYLAARSIPPLRIPPGLSSHSFENQYPVSDRQYPEAAKTVSLVPPGLMNG